MLTTLSCYVARDEEIENLRLETAFTVCRKTLIYYFFLFLAGTVCGAERRYVWKVA
jgi:hypothetical protein